MNILFSLIFLTLPLATLAQEFYPTYNGMNFPEVEHHEYDSLVENGFYNDAFRLLPSYLERGVKDHNLRSLMFVKQKAQDLVYRIRLSEKEVEAIFHEFHVVWDKADEYEQNIIGWMLLTLLDSYKIRQSFGYDEESLSWYVGDGYTKLYNESVEVLQQVYSEQILDGLYKTTRIPVKALINENDSLLPTLGDRLFAYFMDQTDKQVPEERLALLQDLIYEYHYQRKEWTAVRYLILNCRRPWEYENDDYIELLEKWEGLIEDENATYLSLKIARHKYSESQNYNYKLNREVENQAVQALNKIDRTLEKYPNAPVREELEKLKEVILEKTLRFEIKTVPKPKKPTLLSISYSNLEEVYMEVRHVVRVKDVYPYDPRTFKGYRYEKEKYRQTHALIDRKLYLNHTTDLLVECFPTTGLYLVVIGKDRNEVRDFFKLKPEDPLPTTSYALIEVTNLGVSLGETNDSLFVQVANRFKGKPIKKAQVLVKGDSVVSNYITDKNGLAKIPVGKRQAIYIQKEEDSTRISSWQRYHWEVDQSKDVAYTDRPIYRPGQMVQLKLIALKQEGYNLKVDANAKRTLLIRNQQDEVLYSEELTVNSLGSFSSSIALKESIATGYYLIESNGNVIGSFRVEEYKRPTFSVEFDPIKGLMANKNPVTISGTVMAYAGYPLASELVKIHVRKWEYKGYSYSRLTTHASDTVYLVYTDNSGRFAFVYTPQLKENSFGTSIFCEASVTRNTGETNFGEASFYIGNERYQMHSEKVVRDEWNIEGYRTTITGNNESNIDKFVDFYILKRKNVKRYVQEIEPAEFSRFSGQEWRKTFPNMLYGELEKEYDTITMGVVQTGEVLNLDQFDLESGEYKIIFSVIMSTKEVLTNEDAFVWREKGWNYTIQPLEIYAKKKDPALMEFLPIRINTAWRKVHLFEVLENEHKMKFSTYPLKVGHDFTLKLDSSFYSGGQIYASFWKDGYHFNNSYEFHPKDTTRKLEWRWIHKVNESEPGRKETWSFEVRDAYGYFVEGEALLNAYDASLDQFAQGKYRIPYASSNFRPSTWKSEGFYGGSNNGQLFLNARMAEGTVAYFANSANYKVAGSKAGSMNDKKETTSSENGSGVRSNFAETALFIPQFRTKAGVNEFEMKLPDNLTTYHFNGVVHTTDGRFVLEQSDFVVKKKLMLEMNQPRFIRSKDEMNWEINFRNLSNKDLRLKPVVQFFSIETGEDITAQFKLQPLEEQTIKPGKSQAWLLPFVVPNLDAREVKIRIEGRTLDYSDILENRITVLPSADEKTFAQSFVLYPKSNKRWGLNLAEKIVPNAELLSARLSYSADEHLLYLDRLVRNFFRDNELTESYFYQFAAFSVAQHLMQTVHSLSNLAEGRANQLKGASNTASVDELWPDSKTDQERLFQGYQMLLNPEVLENARNQAYQKLLAKQDEKGLWSWVGKGYGNAWLTTHIIDEYVQLGDLGVLFDGEPFLKALKAIDSLKTLEFEKLVDPANFVIDEASLIWYQARTSLGMEETKASAFFKTKLDSTWRKLPAEDWSRVASIYILQEDNMSAEVIYKAIVKMKLRDTSLGVYWAVKNNRVTGYKEDINLRNQILGWKMRHYAVPPDSMRLYLLQNLSGKAQLSPNIDLLLATFYLSLKKNSSISGEIQAFGGEVLKVDRLSGERFIPQPPMVDLQKGIKADNYGDNFIVINAEVDYRAQASEVLKSDGEFRIERQYYLVYNGLEIPMKKGITLHEGSLIRIKLKIISPIALSYLEVEDPRMAGAEPKELESGYQYNDFLYWISPRDVKTTFYVENLPAGTTQLSYDVVLTNKGVLVAPAASVKSYYQPAKKANTEGGVWNIEP